MLLNKLSKEIKAYYLRGKDYWKEICFVDTKITKEWENDINELH
jgi:hypothetical protein